MFPAGSSPAAGPVGRKDPPNRPFERGGKNQMHTLRASQSKSCVHTYACGGGRPGFAGRVGGEPSRVVVPQPPPACFAATDTRNPFARCEASGLREQAVLSWVSGSMPGRGPRNANAPPLSNNVVSIRLSFLRHWWGIRHSKPDADPQSSQIEFYNFFALRFGQERKTKIHKRKV